MKTSVTLGGRFFSLTVIARAGSSAEGRALWLCRCDCGKQTNSTSKQLTTGRIRACEDCQDSGSKSQLAVRLRKYVVEASGCWNWQGKRNSNGYGVMTVEGRETRAHRAMYYMLNPRADTLKVVMHTCDNPRCVNPDHLKLGTQRENMLDMHKKKRFKGGAKIGNQNAKGNKGWMRGGVTAKYASKLGDTVEVPDNLE